MRPCVRQSIRASINPCVNQSVRQSIQACVNQSEPGLIRPSQASLVMPGPISHAGSYQSCGVLAVMRVLSVMRGSIKSPVSALPTEPHLKGMARPTGAWPVRQNRHECHVPVHRTTSGEHHVGVHAVVPRTGSTLGPCTGMRPGPCTGMRPA